MGDEADEDEDEEDDELLSWSRATAAPLEGGSGALVVLGALALELEDAEETAETERVELSSSAMSPD